MLKRLAYKIVFNDLIKCNMFVGKYDARNGNEDFMYGINTVMEYIAYAINNKTGNFFTEKFTKNMIESKKSA